MPDFPEKSLLKCKNGCVATSQVLASQVGVDILRRGGNAADAAVASAAALNVLEPYSTGIGGDMFCIFYDKKSKSLQGLNGSGFAPECLTLDRLNSLGFSEESKPDCRDVNYVTVPGACAGWIDCVEKFGSGNMKMSDILEPAISLARNGFPVAGPITAECWDDSSHHLKLDECTHGCSLLVKDKLTGSYRAPEEGEMFTNPQLADVFKSVAQHGKDGFYKGWVADAMVDVVGKLGGVLKNSDLEKIKTEFVEPISMTYKNVKLWEIPPNGQGLVALQALNILKNFDISKLSHNGEEYLHLLIDAIRLSFADAVEYIADPLHANVPVEQILNNKYGLERAKLISKDGKCCDPCLSGDPSCFQSDTVYLTAADKFGNHCSFINSTYMGFGSGIVPKSCGFTLQNRGFNFSLKPGHSNCVAPFKRPYHTIIPAMVTDATTNDLLMSYGVMGGFMQPQGHVQVLLNMIEFGMNPQEALNAPRFMVGGGHASSEGGVVLEQGISPSACQALKKRGHDITASNVTSFPRKVFGRGQIIANSQFWDVNSENNVIGECYYAGSDVRADGCALGY